MFLKDYVDIDLSGFIPKQKFILAELTLKENLNLKGIDLKLKYKMRANSEYWMKATTLYLWYVSKVDGKENYRMTNIIDGNINLDKAQKKIDELASLKKRDDFLFNKNEERRKIFEQEMEEKGIDMQFWNRHGDRLKLKEKRYTVEEAKLIQDALYNFLVRNEEYVSF